jgi:predicted lactoylglutathione lyase
VKPRIAVCNIAVSDLAQSRRFYEGMGFEARPESNDHAVFFELEWSWLALFTYSSLAESSGTPAESSGPPAFCFSHFVKTAEEVDAVISQAVSLGGSVAIEPSDGPYGRIGYFADPDGYRWKSPTRRHGWCLPTNEHPTTRLVALSAEMRQNAQRYE